MKLDYDCIRNILISLEDLLQLGDNLKIPTVSLEQLFSCGKMQNYSEQNIAYCTQKLKEAGFINASIIVADGRIYSILYSSITFEGHQYLDSIRSNAVWEKVKSSFVEKGLSLTFDLILKVAPSIAVSILNL